MPRSAAPADDARADDPRARLRSLGAGRGAGWGGRDAVEVGGREELRPPDGARVGWPGAAPGTPAARLRLPPRDPDPPAARDHGWWDDRDDPWRQVDGDEGDDPAPGARRGSAWDPPERGERARRWVSRWVPASWAGARWDPGRTGALALAAVAAVAAVLAAVGVWSDRPVAEPVPALPVVAGASAGPGDVSGDAPGAGSVEGPIVVSVSGKVARPGLVRLPPGSRVGEAIDAAGGASPDADLTGLNLAARLSDGEQVVVGVPAAGSGSAGSGSAGSGSAGAAPAGGGAGGAGGAASGGKVDLNTATLEQLDQLPGVGPVTAQRILEWRAQNGRFGAVEQLQEVSGIGDARFATLRDLVTV